MADINNINFEIEMPKMPEFDAPVSKANKDKEMELWKRFKKGDQSAKWELIQSLKPIIMNNVLKYKNSNMPLAKLEGKAYVLVSNSIGRYDPSKSQLNTFVFNQLLPLKREVMSNADMHYIPEKRALNISTYQDATRKLSDELNREPTTYELADNLKWSVKEVERMRNEMRGNLVEDLGVMSVFTERNKDLDRIEMVYSELGPDDQLAMEYLMGMHGKEELTIAQTASRLNKTPDQIRRVKEKIAKKFNEFN